MGEVDTDTLRLTETTASQTKRCARPTGSIRTSPGCIAKRCWECARRSVCSGHCVSIGIDTWGVDYGLLDDTGRLLGNPFHYRDPRNELGVAAVHGVISQQDLYARNGLQFLPFNTIYQLAADKAANRLDAGGHRCCFYPICLATGSPAGV